MKSNEEAEIRLAVVFYLSRENLCFRPDTVLTLLKKDVYKDLFSFAPDGELTSKSQETLEEFIAEILVIEIDNIIKEMVEEGIGEYGVDKNGEIVYSYPPNMTREDVDKMIDIRLQRLR